MFPNLSPHLPVVQVILPLIAAPICVIFRRAGFAWLIALIASWLSLGVSIFLLDIFLFCDLKLIFYRPL